MKPMIVILGVLFLAGVLHGQDPTVPSPAILDRIQPSEVRAPMPEAQPLPVFKLRAMVMRTQDQGSAIIEANGSRLYLRLDRSMLLPRESVNESNGPIGGIEYQGVYYRLEDFSNRSIVLTDGQHRIRIR